MALSRSRPRRNTADSEGRRVAMTMRLAVDWINCKAHGMCYELFPERISPDDWGYPMIDVRPIPPDLQPITRTARTPARPWRCSCGSSE